MQHQEKMQKNIQKPNSWLERESKINLMDGAPLLVGLPTIITPYPLHFREKSCQRISPGTWPRQIGGLATEARETVARRFSATPGDCTV